MFDFIFVAQALGAIDFYFQEEVTDEDFWEVPPSVYEKLGDSEKERLFTINPQRLKEVHRNAPELLVLTESERVFLMQGFQMLRSYTPTLPEDAHLNERLLMAKSKLPPVIFDRNKDHDQKEGDVIPLFKK